MRSALLISLLLFVGMASTAQTAPPNPAACFVTKGTAAMTITGSTTFVLDDLTDFTTSEAISTININVDCNKRYRVYIAGQITAQPPNINVNTVIPIGTFTVVATEQNGGPLVSFPLAGPSAYQILIENGKTTGSKGRDHLLTITRNALNTFTQAPGGHTLYLHFYLCQIE
jgi:hypothetical protein